MSGPIVERSEWIIRRGNERFVVVFDLTKDIIRVHPMIRYGFERTLPLTTVGVEQAFAAVDMYLKSEGKTR